MKNLNKFLTEALIKKDTKLNPVPWGDSFERFCESIDNLSINNDYLKELDVQKFINPNGPRYWWLKNEKIAMYVVYSFKYGYEYALDLIQNKDYDRIIFLIKFDTCQLACLIDDKYEGDIFIIGPKDINIKSVVNISKSAYDIYCGINTTLPRDINIVLDKVYYILSDKLKNKVIDKYYSNYSIGPSPDVSPYKLRKNKKFPSYITHCIVKGSNNTIVKKYTWDEEAEIFVQTVEKDGKKYYKVLMGDVNRSFNRGQDETSIYYLISLGQLDKFLEFTLKPHRHKKTSWIGGDGDIHYGSSKMNKSMPTNLKQDLIKDDKLIKELNFQYMDIFDLYK